MIYHECHGNDLKKHKSAFPADMTFIPIIEKEVQQW